MVLNESSDIGREKFGSNTCEINRTCKINSTCWYPQVELGEKFPINISVAAVYENEYLIG